MSQLSLRERPTLGLHLGITWLAVIALPIFIWDGGIKDWISEIKATREEIARLRD